jgi:hypothetical protein
LVCIVFVLSVLSNLGLGAGRDHAAGGLFGFLGAEFGVVGFGIHRPFFLPFSYRALLFRLFGG